jgi:translation initiation factor IF-2
MTKDAKTKQSSSRPPIVAVVGHVDHGKTTLLDFIRNTTIAAREHGGITQHIGAYQVTTKPKGKSGETHTITFIDTPGHEAFSKMRSRGAQVADIAILVVDAVDSVMPQTKESIAQIKAANIPFIVALNKIDLPGANPAKVKQDLAKAGVQVEGFGGEVPMVSVSAKVGTGVPELLDMIALVAEMQEITANPIGKLSAIVIETKLDKGKGMVASVIVKNGTINVGKQLYEGIEMVARVRAMFDEYGKPVSSAIPGKPVEVLGFTVFPHVGQELTDEPFTNLEPKISAPQNQVNKPLEMPDFLKPIEEEKESLKIVIKADTAGTLEAIIASLDTRIQVVSSGVGSVTEADILLARSTRSFVIGFNVKASLEVEKLAQAEKVVLRTYTIIYELINELTEVVEGIKEVLTKERELGTGLVIAEFPFNHERVAGIKVTQGRIARGDNIKFIRADVEIGKTRIKSIRHGKEETSKVETGVECGILFDKKVDFLIGDVIIAVTNI